jgi:hypothetical protein
MNTFKTVTIEQAARLYREQRGEALDELAGIRPAPFLESFCHHNAKGLTFAEWLERNKITTYEEVIR